MPLHELTKPERDYFLRAAAFLLEAFPQIAEEQWEYAVMEKGGHIATGWLSARAAAGQCVRFDSDVIVRRRRAGEWEKAE